MAWFETWIKNDLAKPINVVQLQGVMFNLDNLANKIGVELEYNGQPAALEGTIAGYVIRNDGTTLNLTTNTGKEGNKAWVILPQEAYTVEGPISIVIKLVYNSAETTIGACAGYVTRSRTSSEIAPTGTVIPSLASLEAAIAAANAAAANAADAVDYIAPTEEDSTASMAHAAGSYFIYNGKLMNATSAIAQGATIVPYASGVSNYNCVEVPNGLSGSVYNVTNTANAAANNAADAQQLVAPVESMAGMPTSTATMAHATGSYFVYGGALHMATADIAIGDTIVTSGADANCKAVPGGLGGEVSDLKSAIDGIQGIVTTKIVTTNYWELNAWKVSDGSSTGNNKRIRTVSSAAELKSLDRIVKSDATVEFYVSYYGEGGSYITQESHPFVHYANIRKEAPDGAISFRLTARSIPEANLSSIVASTGAKISIYKSALDELEDEIGDVRQEYKSGRELLKWYLGETRNTTSGDITATNAKTYATTDLAGASPLGTVHYTGSTSDADEIDFVVSCFEYNANKQFIKYSSIIGEDITLTENTYYVAFRFGRASSTNVVIKRNDLNNFNVEITQSKISATYTDLVNANKNMEELLKAIGYIELPPFITGSRHPGGAIVSNTKSVTTTVPFNVTTNKKIKIMVAQGWAFGFYGRNGDSGTYTLIGRSDTNRIYEVNYDTVFINVIHNGETIDPADAQNIIALFYLNDDEISVNPEKHDVPKNLGVINTLLNAKQLLNITYTPTASMPQQSGDFPPGEEKTGMVYSSTREEELFVPQTVSFDSFMTAVMNPNSYLYTRRSYTSNSKTYYGCVCSTFVGHCYGIRDYIPTTFMLDKLPGMERIGDQSAYGLELGDMLLKSGSHAMIVVDIIRNIETGYIKNLTIAEAWHPVCRTRTFTPSSFKSNIINDGYVAYRNNNIFAVTYLPSPWVHLNDESTEPFYNTYLSPRRGDKANWRTDETVEIDVLDAGDFTQYKLYKGTTLISTESIPANMIISLANLEYGSYKVCLTDGTTDSGFVYFIIVDCSETYTASGNGTVVCEFASENAQPTSLCWNYDPLSHDNKTYVIFRIDQFTSEEITAGEITCTEEPGTYYLRVTYKTEYGLYYSDVQKVVVT